MRARFGIADEKARCNEEAMDESSELMPANAYSRVDPILPHKTQETQLDH